MQSEVARLFVYQFNVSWFWNAVSLTSNFIVLPSSMTENIGFKTEFTLSTSSVKVGFTDITFKGHSQLWDRADLGTSFLTLKKSSSTWNQTYALRISRNPL